MFHLKQNKKMKRIAIIGTFQCLFYIGSDWHFASFPSYFFFPGTAGRKEDGPKMNRVLFDRMVMFASETIQSKFKLKDIPITIVSGGLF